MWPSRENPYRLIGFVPTTKNQYFFCHRFIFLSLVNISSLLFHQTIWLHLIKYCSVEVDKNDIHVLVRPLKWWARGWHLRCDSLNIILKILPHGPWPMGSELSSFWTAYFIPLWNCICIMHCTVPTHNVWTAFGNCRRLRNLAKNEIFSVFDATECVRRCYSKKSYEKYSNV